MHHSLLKKYLHKASDNLARNWLIAVPSIVVIALVLTLFHGLLIVHENARDTLNNISQKFSITVYLRDDADPFEIGNIITELENRQDVIAPVIYTSKEAAWRSISETFSLDNELLKKYQFSLPASLTIAPVSPSDTPRIEAFLETNAPHLLKDPLISQNKQKNITTQMVDFIEGVKNSTLRTLIFFIVLFVFAGALLMSSTIHLAITSRSKEISIMKLVGASSSTITAPFIIESVMISVAAFLVHLILLFIIPSGISADAFSLNVLIFELAAVILLGVTSSYVTTRIYLHRKIFV